MGRAEPGTPIEGSRYVVAYCASCGEQIRVLDYDPKEGDFCHVCDGTSQRNQREFMSHEIQRMRAGRRRTDGG